MSISTTTELYSLRRSFSVIGLTGRMGSGCTRISEILTSDKESFFRKNDLELRNPIDLKLPMKDNFQMNLFKRKYQICYNFFEKHHIKYQVIEYKKVLLLAMLACYIKDENAIDSINQAVANLFKKSSVEDDDFPDIVITPEELKGCAFTDELENAIIELQKMKCANILEAKEVLDFHILRSEFFNSGSSFNIWADGLIKFMEGRNNYLRTFFFHKVAVSLRALGKPNGTQKEIEQANTQNVYFVAKLINRLIKAFKADVANKNNCHILINSLKNSLEIMFFKERYSAFYLMAINNAENYESNIALRVRDDENKEISVKKLIDLDETECKSDDFSKGNFFAPDVENCVQKAEIHINNIDKLEPNVTGFYTSKEQLLKVLSLIQQPGIITPSNQERCMLVAYNSKYNSGCISRQVGAVLTDGSFSVKSVGWNDVPKQSITCLLKSATELIENKVESEDKTYSPFETVDSSFKYLKNKDVNKSHVGENFHENISNEITEEKRVALEEDGKNCSFCFKSMHNKFEGEKNQVHTRSLHAEENAMLQITKYGGQAILNGKLFTTASPCELCAKKACQIGVKEIYYIDPYPGISMEHVLKQGNAQPELIAFNGIIGKSFNKLYEPFMSYKDEISLY